MLAASENLNLYPNTLDNGITVFGHFWYGTVVKQY